MSRYFAIQLRSWAFPVIVFTLSAALWLSVPHDRSSDTSSVGVSVENQESALQQKAVRVLEGLGEDSPVVVVTISTEEGYRVERKFTPSAKDSVVETSQRTTESLLKESLVTDSSEKDYKNEKEAVNYMVGQTVITRSVEGTHIKSVSCLAEICEANAPRTTEIEAALSVALGLDAERGDRALVIIRR